MASFLKRLFGSKPAPRIHSLGVDARAEAEALKDQGNELFGQGNLDGALSCYQTAIERCPNFAQGYANIGILLKERKQYPEAAGFLQKALSLNQNDWKVHYHLAELAERQKNFEKAIVHYQSAKALAPDETELYWRLAFCLGRLYRNEDAIELLQVGLERWPEQPGSYNNLASMLRNAKRNKEAEEIILRGLEAHPDNPDLLESQMWTLWSDIETHQTETERLYQKLTNTWPDRPGSHHTFGLMEQYGFARYASAEASFRRALAIAPNDAGIRWDFSLLLLTLGHYEEGWQCYEARYDLNTTRLSMAVLPSLAPRWKGQDLSGKTILMWDEQGYGDDIQFCRYAKVLKNRGASRVIMVCKAPLTALFQSLSDVDELLPLTSETQLPRHDYWTMPMSAPAYCGTTLTSIPAELPYLAPPADRIPTWQARLPKNGFKVGLVWKGNPQHGNDAHRSLPGLQTLAPLWSVPNIRFISLQKGAGEDEAKTPPIDQPLLHLGSEIGDLADTAAIISQLDLVICVDTAVAHLCGALGKPCWVMLPKVAADWRWLLERADSPWYPGSVRLFRQTERNNWLPVIQSIALDLSLLVSV